MIRRLTVYLAAGLAPSSSFSSRTPCPSHSSAWCCRQAPSSTTNSTSRPSPISTSRMRALTTARSLRSRAPTRWRRSSRLTCSASRAPPFHRALHPVCRLPRRARRRARRPPPPRRPRFAARTWVTSAKRTCCTCLRWARAATTPAQRGRSATRPTRRPSPVRASTASSRAAAAAAA